MTGSTFLKAWTRDHRIGAITRSSRQTIARASEALPRHCARVVEYGPGDGIMTRALLQRIPAHGTLLAIEQNPTFLTDLGAIDDTRLRIRIGDIRADALVLRNLAGGAVDAVVSSAPLGLFSSVERDALIQATRNALQPGGTFIVCQYTPLVFPSMRRHFASVATHIVPRNLPPYFVFVATA